MLALLDIMALLSLIGSITMAIGIALLAIFVLGCLLEILCMVLLVSRTVTRFMFKRLLRLGR